MLINPDKFTFFWNGSFSSWHIAPIVIDGNTWNCCEQYFMFKKAATFDDEKIAVKIWRCNDPRQQKKLGRQVAHFVPKVWDRVSRDFMHRAHWAKFTQHPHLRKELLKTGDTTLVEASPYDKLWGIGLAEDNPLASNRMTWEGKNWLGEILTEIKLALVNKDHYNIRS
jgi:ribA/ribD-fused uncharacterized protein